MHRFAAILLLTVLTSVCHAMPPAPGVMDMVEQEGRLQTWIDLNIDAHARGVNAPFEFNLDRLRRDGSDEIEVRAICILVDFDDNEADQERYSVEHFEDLLFSEDELPRGSVREWYLENSYDEVGIVGEVHGWYRMPQDYEYYVDNQRGLGEYPQNAQRLTEDALTAADEDIDYSDFDNDDDGVVEALFIVHAGPGAEATGRDTHIHSHSWNVPQGIRLDGVRFARYAMEPEDGNIGVFGHELAHSFFGLPDLYDGTYRSAGIGRWSMMAGGSWGGGGTLPAHFDAWCKKRIGFIEPYPVVGNYEDIVLEPVELVDDVLIAWRHGNWQREYFLIENRQRIGSDQSLPGSGLLIWHIDEQVNNNNNPWWPGENEGHYKVALEQADGNYDMEHNRNNGDMNDPWSGGEYGRIFSAETEPSSRDYFLLETDVTVYNIEQMDSMGMGFDIAVFPVSIGDLSLFVLNRIPDDHFYQDPDIDDEEVMINESNLVTRNLSQIGAEIDSIGPELPEILEPYNVILYLESWREEDEVQDGLTLSEQEQLIGFLDDGNRLILVGPDVATNLQGEDNPLWDYLNAEYIDEGNPSEEGNVRILRADATSPISGQTFPYRHQEACDHYVDEVGPAEGSSYLFKDDGRRMRGVITEGEGDYRLVLQPFLFGGLIDWGGTKVALLNLYFRYFQFYLSVPENDLELVHPDNFELISAWPNPFNNVVNISYLGDRRIKSIDIYDALGRKVGQLFLTDARNTTTWEPVGLPSGAYYLLPRGNNNLAPRRIVLLK